MKASLQFLIGLVLVSSLIISGCSSDSSSPTSTSGGTSRIEGQLSNDAAGQSAKAASIFVPVNGVTIELVQNGVVLDVTLTDEYGRFQFIGLPSGQYTLRVVANTVYQYQVSLNVGDTVTVYGIIESNGEVEWKEEEGSHWDEMPEGTHWDDNSNDDSRDDSSDDSRDDSSDDSRDDSSDDSRDDSSDDSRDDSSDDSRDDDGHHDSDDDKHDDSNDDSRDDEDDDD